MRFHPSFRPLIILAFASLQSGCLGSSEETNAAPIKAVAAVEIDKYLGKWYEIARYPNRFERNCEFVTANYSIIEVGSNKGNIRVVNTCVRNGQKDKPIIARGVAKPLANSNNAILAVNFAPIPLPQGDGNYHIMYLDDSYQNAVIGEPSRKFLWLLSRSPNIGEENKAKMLKVAQDNGYDISKLEYVRQ